MTRTTDNEATETVSEVTLTASAVNSIQINGANTSTKESIGEGNCTCWYNKCTQHLNAQIFFAVTMYIIGANLSEPLMVIESHRTHVSVSCQQDSVNIINSQFMRNKLDTLCKQKHLHNKCTIN